jgi:tetratricopeptide (TPR) repeat protein
MQEMQIKNPRALQQARALADARRYSEAQAVYRQLLVAEPGLADVWYELAWLLRKSGDPDAALEAYSEALHLGVRDPEEVHLNRAVIYSDERHQEALAEDELLSALRIRADYAPARLNLGKLYEDQGRTAEAVDCYRQLSDDSGPQQPNLELRQEALCRLVQAEPPSDADDPRLARLIAAATQAGDRSDGHTANLWFGVARAWETLSRYDDAFNAFERANRLAASGGPPYARAAIESLVEALIEAGDLPPFEAAADKAGPTPLFICGMFRSGSTLLEQVLNAHPQVSAGGELAFFPRLKQGPQGRAASCGQLSPAQAQQAGQAYRQLIQNLMQQGTADARYFSDKRPDNVLLLRLIRQVLPDARIIITRRNPVDTGLSVFQQHLSPAVVPYSTRLTDIAHYQLQVETLTRHWLSSGDEGLFKFDYDHFVSEPEAELRPLLTWLQLDWDSRCLDFHRQHNAVKTASHAQVRKPLYRDSSGRWQHYAAHLGPLIDALRDGGMQL